MTALPTNHVLNAGVATGEGLAAGNERARSARLLRGGGWSAACGWTGARGRVPAPLWVARVSGGESTHGVREATGGPIPVDDEEEAGRDQHGRRCR